jgi:hypothetical protein
MAPGSPTKKYLLVNIFSSSERLLRLPKPLCAGIEALNQPAIGRPMGRPGFSLVARIVFLAVPGLLAGCGASPQAAANP